MDARDFAISGKDSDYNVGFRGIGIYSGFDLCNRLLVTTKPQGEVYANVLEFDFKGMKTQLANERHAARGKRTPLTKLISDYSRFKRERRSEAKDMHYTVVQMEQVSNVHIDLLSNRQTFKRYILRNLPIDFADDFPYREELRQELESRIRGYNAVRIVLLSDTQGAETISRPMIPNLGRPKTGVIKNKDTNEVVAFYWAALHRGRTRIPDEYADFRGLLYKIKGFTIGDSNRVKKEFPKRGNGAHFEWYTGEIFVLDSDVIPNTERYDFEANHAKTQLEAAVRDVLGDLDKEADRYRNQVLTQDEFVKAHAQYLTIKEQVDTGKDRDFLELYRKLGDIRDNLNARKSKVAKGWKAENGSTPNEIIAEIEQLETDVRHAINNPLNGAIGGMNDDSMSANSDSLPLSPDASAHQGQSIFPEDVSVHPSPIVPDTQLVSRNASSTTDALPSRIPTASSPSSGVPSPSTTEREVISLVVPSDNALRSLMRAIENAGWQIDDECGHVVGIIDACAVDVLVAHPDLYDNLLAMVEARLSADTIS